MSCKAYMQRHMFALTLAALVAGAGPLPAAADEPADGQKPFEFSANVGIATDYRFRGFTQTQEHPAVQGGVDLTFGSFYVGFWSSNVDFGRTQDSSGRFHEQADFELDVYGGIKRKLGPIEWNLGIIGYLYPGSYGVVVDDERRDLDYMEVYGSISGDLHTSLNGSFTIYYSPDYFGEVGDNWVFEGTLTRKLGAIAGVDPSLSATLGYSEGDESDGGYDYWYWNAGFSFIFAEYFEFDLRYFDTIDVPEDLAGDCSGRCDGRVVARLTFEY
jgi:uncharacterized protein (TIGR02001 family)